MADNYVIFTELINTKEAERKRAIALLEQLHIVGYVYKDYAYMFEIHLEQKKYN